MSTIYKHSFINIHVAQWVIKRGHILPSSSTVCKPLSRKLFTNEFCYDSRTGTMGSQYNHVCKATVYVEENEQPSNMHEFPLPREP